MSVGMLHRVGWSLVVIAAMVSSAAAQATRLPREAQPRPPVGFLRDPPMTPVGGAELAPTGVPTIPADAEVEVAVVKRGIFPEFVMTVGQVEADRVVPIQAKVGGYVEKVEVEEGDAVKKGQLLVTIAAPELGAAREVAAARLDLAEIERRRAEAVLKGARVRLVDIEASGATKRIDEEARAAVELAEADLQAATARQVLARAEIRKAELDATALRLVAPFDGTVTACNVVPGQLATPAGAPLLVVSKLDTVRIRAPFERDDGIALRAGDAVKLFGAGDRAIDARIGRVGVAVDPESQTVPVQVVVKNDDGRWRPGMNVQVELVPKAKPPCLLVTQWAVWEGSEGTYCIRIVEGRARRSAVKLGRWAVDPLGLCEVLEGLSEGDQVITKEGQGLNMESRYPIYLPEGCPVRITKKGQEGPAVAR